MEQTLLIKGGQIITPERYLSNGWLYIKDGVIQDIGSEDQIPLYEAGNTIHLQQGEYVFPGFIDIHIHGASGYDFMDGQEAVESIAHVLPQEGTTSFLATTITSDENTTIKALEGIAAYAKRPSKGAELLGVHLEGPFINPVFAGAQPISAIQVPNIEQFKYWNEVADQLIKVVTLASEQPNGNSLIDFLHNQRIVPSIGHSNATFEEVQLAIESGLKHATHFYNAMSKLHHREPGVVGSVLLSDLYAEIIFDGIHVRDEMVELAVRMKTSDRMILITDSMRGKNLSNGSYDLGGQQVTLNNGEARLNDGTLAGSVLKMNEAVRHMSQINDVSLIDLAKMSSMNAAQSLGLTSKGSLDVGKDADVVIMDRQFNVNQTIVDGNVVYEVEE
ncbi:N-acetylglucosamine-6-phosphate deacetylase [Aquisalibacillus elongatus]|uniref:N-acetylglucosamine-6-phosphate deacetylase n=1 Tax=Aquisalibacillus elongatus TaxID=485577 RepID=A0A3N5BG97_9BACI|nr:N-acetylglucosamine-6-phosphate deacetylase [Aquisalibacillus elongatus]RPF54290.1 N-acetylglucosamine-6-phosphate deacetylase [Aquisalibacillus elongatus]